MADIPEPPPSVRTRLEAWGNSSLSPTLLATLVTSLHFRPLQWRPMLFVPLLLFSSYANLQGFKKDSAGLTAAAGGTYALLASRRQPGSPPGAAWWRRFASARGLVRAAAMGLGAANALAAGWVYATADREAERRQRLENPRWGAAGPGGK